MNRKLVTLAAAALMTMSVSMFGAPQQKAPAAKSTTSKTSEPKSQPTHTTKGTVSSVSTSQLMVSLGKGKKDLTFMLDSNTQRPTNLAAGDKVTVHYRVENNQNMATSVQAQAPKNAGNTAKKKT